MTFRLLETAPFLGAYVLLAGLYGVAYCFYRLEVWPAGRVVSLSLFALHASVAAGIIVWAPLALPWKVLIAASSAVIFVIPSLTWKFLEHTHLSEGGHT